MNPFTSLRTWIDEGVLLLCLADADTPTPDPQEWMTSQELARWRSFALPVPAAEFRMGRWLLRLCARGLFGRDEPPLTDPRGRPYWASPPQAPLFSLAHSSGFVALALHRIGPIGVDLEDPRRHVNAHALAHRFFTPAEREWVDRDGSDAFWRVWTRKEALLKAEGSGLAGRISRVDVLAAEAEGWHFAEWVESSRRLCVASRSPGSPLKVWRHPFTSPPA